MTQTDFHTFQNSRYEKAVQRFSPCVNLNIENVLFLIGGNPGFSMGAFKYINTPPRGGVRSSV